VIKEMEGELENLKFKIGFVKIDLKKFIEELFKDLILQIEGVTIETFYDFFLPPAPAPANSFAPADDRLSSKVGFQDITEDAGLARGVVELAAEFVDLAGELVRTTGRVLELTLTGACRSGELVDLSSVLGKFALHVVERGGGGGGGASLRGDGWDRGPGRPGHRRSGRRNRHVGRSVRV